MAGSHYHTNHYQEEIFWLVEHKETLADVVQTISVHCRFLNSHLEKVFDHEDKIFVHFLCGYIPFRKNITISNIRDTNTVILSHNNP